MHESFFQNIKNGWMELDIMFDTNIKIALKSIYNSNQPIINWRLDSANWQTVKIKDKFEICICQKLSIGVHKIEIEYNNKTDDDLLSAVIIEKILVENISTVSVSQGTYYPEFPEPWASEQRAIGVDLFETYKTSTHLGWNGRWEFVFDVPTFSWIHKVENLGDIYPLT